MGARPRAALLGLTCIVILTCTSLQAGRESDQAPAAPAELPAAPSSTPHFRFFSANSFWNQRRRAHPALARNSARLVRAFERQIATETRNATGPTINTSAYSVPIYTVGEDTPTVAVTLQSSSAAPALRAAWSAVPLPANAQPAAGSDGHLVVWQPGSERLWEFWRLALTPDGWQASWGGAIDDVSANPGVYGPGAWPGATASWGASASSLSIAGGLITLEDLEHGRIEHALAIGIPHVRAGVFVSPARRTDGRSTSLAALPEGAHLILDPTLRISTLHLPALTRMLAEAAQRYGIIVRDSAARVAFYAQDPTPTGTNPYTAPDGYFEGQTPSSLLRSFPWAHLQLLAMALHHVAQAAPTR